MKWYGKLYIGILLAILYIPIFFLMFYSFNSAGNMIHFEHFTLEHYQSLFQNDRLMSVIFNTVAVALLANFNHNRNIWCHFIILFKK